MSNLTQEELSALCGLDRTTIIRYESNLVDHSLENLNKIAAALKIDPSILYDDYFKFLSNDYGFKIKQIRKSLNLTQKKFGQILGVHRKTISNWEKEIIIPGRDNYKNLIGLK